MNDFLFFILGIIGGFVLATPLGPVNLLVIDRALAKGSAYGTITGLGAVAGDLIYSAIAIYGVGYIVGFFDDYIGFIEVGGGLLLLAFGLHAFRLEPHVKRQKNSPSALPVAVLTTFSLTMSNPGSLFGYLAFFGALAHFIEDVPLINEALAIVLGIGLGSFLWWLTLAAIASHMRTRLSDRWLGRISKGSGAFLLLFGAGVILKGGLSFFGIQILT